MASESPRAILTIGREPDNDLVLDVPTVSAHHARVLWQGDPGEVVVEDLGSSNGTAVGAPDRKATRAVVRPGDTIYLGSQPLPASVIFARLVPAAPSKLAVGRAPMVLGRDPSCDFVIADPVVSGRHARLAPRGDGSVSVEDLGSSNGTFVNGRRVDRIAEARAGDTIGLGTRNFLLETLTSSPTVPISVHRGPDPTRIVERPAVEFPINAPIPIPTPPPLGLNVPAPPQIHVPPPLPSTVPARSSLPSPEVWALGAAMVAGPLLSLGFALGMGRPVPAGMGVPAGLSTLLARLAVIAVATGLAVAVSGRSSAWSRGLPAWAREPGALALGVLVSCLLSGMIAEGVTGAAGGAGGLFLLALAGAIGFAIGLAVEALAPSRGVARGIVGVLVMAFWLVGAEPSLLPRLPGWAKALAGFSPSRWALEGLLLLESARRSTGADGPIDLAESLFPAETDRMGLPAVFTAMAALLIGWGACAAVLKDWRRPGAARSS